MRKYTTTNDTRVISKDLRGSHNNCPFKYPVEMEDEVVNHIRKFPVIESHYCRENTQRQYLDPGLSVTKMYAMYVEEKKDEINFQKTIENNIAEDDDDEVTDKDEDENEVDDGNEVEDVNVNEDEEVEIGNEADEGKKKSSTKELKEVSSEYFVTLAKYRQIFNTKFNLGFFKPEKDM